MVAPGAARSIAIRRACLLGRPGSTGTAGATAPGGGRVLSRLLAANLRAGVDASAAVDFVRVFTTVVATLRVTREVGALVLLRDVLVFMRISWLSTATTAAMTY